MPASQEAQSNIACAKQHGDEVLATLEKQLSTEHTATLEQARPAGMGWRFNPQTMKSVTFRGHNLLCVNTKSAGHWAIYETDQPMHVNGICFHTKMVGRDIASHELAKWLMNHVDSAR
jgi:hypothetical protein